MRFPLRALAIGSLFSVAFAYVAVVAANRSSAMMPGSQICCICILFCVALVLILNPLLRLLRLRILSRGEIILVFIMSSVPAGIPAYGYVCEVIPLIGALHHPEWNTPQSQWNEELVPYLDPELFLGAPLFQERDVRDWRSFNRKLRDAGKSASLSPAKRLWELIPAEVQSTIADAAAGLDFTPEQKRKALVALRERRRARQGKAAGEPAAWEVTLELEKLTRRNRAAIVRAVTHVLSRRDFFTAAAFRHVSLPAAAKELLGRDSHTLLSDEIKRLNRQLLEASFPAEILPSKFVQDQGVIRDYVRGMRARGKEAWPVFVKNPQESWSELGARFWRYCTVKPELDGDEIINWWDFYAVLCRAGTKDAPRAQARVWLLLGTGLQEKIQAVVQHLQAAQGRSAHNDIQAEAARRMEQDKKAVLDGLNGLITGRNLYQVDAFADVVLPPRALTLLSQGSERLGADDCRELNRLLLEAVFPGSIRQHTVSFFGDVAWASWAPPVLRWIFLAFLFFLLFYTLNELIFKQWCKHEQLMFPIAQFSAAILVSDEQKSGSIVPPVFRSGIFWAGFGIAFAVLFYQATAQAQWIPGLHALDLRGPMASHFRETPLEGLIPFRLQIYFPVIGLAFLLPTEISFSIWAFFLIGKFQQLAAVWLGYGVDGRSFRMDWYSTWSFTSAQGGGALAVVGFVYLWRVRRNLFASVSWLATKLGIRGDDGKQSREYVVPSFIFLLTTLGLLYTMRLGSIPWGMAILTYLVLLLFTIAYVRLVAECGLISCRFFFGPLHFVKMFGLLRFPALFAARGIASVAILLHSMFLDSKAFIAPTMLNAKYLADRNSISRRSFVLGMSLGIVLAIVVSSAVAVMMVCDLGMSSMRPWNWRYFPIHTFRNATQMIADPEAMAHPDAAMLGWFALGAAFCGLLIYLRQFLFWLPHPIGLVLFSDDVVQCLWFSIFLGWICKRMAVKYCDTEQYQVIKGFFIGLALGAVAAVGVSTIVGLAYDPSFRLVLDPYG